MGRKLATACTLKFLLPIYNVYGDTSTVTIIYYHNYVTYIYTHVKLLCAIDEQSLCLYATMYMHEGKYATMRHVIV